MTDVSLSDVLPGSRPPGRPRRSDERLRRRRAKRRRRRTAVVLLVALLLVGGGVFAAFSGLAPVVKGLFEPNDYTGPGTGAIKIEVVDGDTGRDIARKLQAAGVVKTANAFADAYTADPKAPGIQPGLYNLQLTMSSVGALKVLTDPGERLQIRVTIPEGYRAKQILDRLAKTLSLSRNNLEAASRDAAAIGLPAAAGGKVEGYLFPATYDFRPDVTAVGALKAMVARTQEVLTGLGVTEAQTRSVITEASIVQAEGRSVEDFGKIARVLDNRLKIKMPLQLDSTVSYATQRFGVTTTPAERLSPSPYNTYVHTGLPVGAISAPGQQAIEAVLDPTPGPWLFFVAVNPKTGETKYAVTKAEHDANVREFQAWMRDNS